ncbi:hypothetical protein Clacol_001626 [Clathrus columnatus]|uniref:TFIID-31kDa-domain-containing protein n=1 Tax=Clathrus columnatus TaxID=1419009 RepID=A0AAV4ZYM8_9AGAM|nr:hypothetical protein Clacol_001626 [Clathrus columnatus]
MAGEQLPPTARSIALLLASTPTIQDSHPAVLHQLLEFSHRYTSQVLLDASVYAEHAGRQGKIDMEDVALAVQARIGWEFGGRVPKEYLLSLAAQTNATPLPSVPEAFGIRLPPPKDRLTAVTFDLVPNPPPSGLNLWEEEVEEEIEESQSENEMEIEEESQKERTAFALPVMARNDDVDMTARSGGSDIDEGGLFGGEDEEASDAETKDDRQKTQRTLIEDEEYD